MSDAQLLDAALRSIGAALLHSLWQGALLGGVTALVLRALGGSRPSARYVVACAGLALMVVAWTATAWQTAAQLVPEARAAARAGAAVPALGPAGPFDFSPAIRTISPADLDDRRPGVARSPRESGRCALVPVWLLGVFGLSLRLARRLGVGRARAAARAPAGRRGRRRPHRRARAPPVGLAAGPRRAVGPRAGAVGRRLAAAGDPAAGERLDGPVARASRRRHRARARPRPPPRLRRQPPADGRRGPALLPPGLLVDLTPHPRRARALLRRHRRVAVRRSPRLRDRAGRSRGAAQQHDAGPCGHRRPAAPARAAAAVAGGRGAAPVRMGRRRSPAGAGPRGDGERHPHRNGGVARRGGAEPGSCRRPEDSGGKRRRPRADRRRAVRASDRRCRLRNHRARGFGLRHDRRQRAVRDPADQGRHLHHGGARQGLRVGRVRRARHAVRRPDRRPRRPRVVRHRDPPLRLRRDQRPHPRRSRQRRCRASKSCSSP